MARVLVSGVAVLDFVLGVDDLPREAVKYRAHEAAVVGGGCGANAAVAIARLGGQAALCARLGDDAIGGLIVQGLAAEGVDVGMVRRTPGARSSFSSVLVDASGERQIVNYRGAGLETDTGWIATAEPADAVLVDTRWTGGAVAALGLARDWGVPGVVDAEDPLDEAVLREASHVGFSREGLLAFAGGQGDDLGAALARAAERLDAWLCVTDGANGALVWTGEGARQVPAFPVEVRDTLGAGDVWHGALALALAEGRDELAAVRWANAAAALKCGRFGGREGAPTRAEMDDFLKEKQA